jgi:UDP-N-acetylglucosamine 2-epimerase (non-hydrolysing)
MVIHLICAARPNFMKIAPLYHALKKEAWATPVIVHTGQHYDLNMSDAFFKDLNLPDPDFHLGVGGGSHGEQTGKILIVYEKLLLKERPGLVVVVGDVNSTLACTLAAAKMDYGNGRSNKSPSAYELPSMSYELGHRPLIAHLEAGLRSFDRSMPEEINRMVTDTLADILWTPSSDADENLIREGISPEKIQRVGNIMIDSLEMLRETISKANAFQKLGLKKGSYGVVTLHRPSNVDNLETLRSLSELLCEISKKINLVFPIHPRTRKNLERFGLYESLAMNNGLILLEPVNYIRFMNLVFNCRVAITDSGGIQEETTHLGIPCLTLRQNTERPVTITHGTNQLCDLRDLNAKVTRILNDSFAKPETIELWDGRTAERVATVIRNLVTR